VADVTPRFAWQNFLQFAGTTIAASSEQPTFKGKFSIDQLRSKQWRSKTGWTIVAGYNDKLDFTEGTTGDATATITAGNYATGALMAAEIETQMDAAATDNTYSVTYNASTNKFVIARDTGSDTIGLEWSTGSNTSTSIGVDLGFDVSADDTGATSYTADNASHQSRHRITYVLPQAQTVELGIVLDHNIDSTGTVTLHGNSSDSWISPAFSQVLADSNTDDTFRLDFFSEQTYRFWQLEFDDVQSSTGYNSIGVAFVGAYFQPSRAHAFEMAIDRVELTAIQLADQGAGFQNVKQAARQFSIEFMGMTNADKTSFETMSGDRRIGRPLFFFFDPQNDSTDMLYCHSASPLAITEVPPTHWRIAVPIQESLG
jgi:hypothetical protein